jgi:hypothetical protein
LRLETRDSKENRAHDSRNGTSLILLHPSSFVRGHVLRLNFLNSNPNPEIIGEEKLSSYSNYFLGRDSCRWRSRVGNYAKVIARDVWPGIDVEYRPQSEGVETVYRVRPGADPSQIMVQYEGLDAPLSVDANGSLRLRTSLGDVIEQAPFAYQIVNGRQVEVRASYRILSGNSCTVQCRVLDAAKELVIDPLVYCSYFAGSAFDWIDDMAGDSSGRVIVCGSTVWHEFPTTPGSYQDSSTGGWHGFITKFNSLGDSLIFSTYFGGLEYMSLLHIARSGSVYYVADVVHGGWPLTPDAFDTSAQSDEIGIALLSADGVNLQFSTYLGGSGMDFPLCCEVDSMDRLYVGGQTSSSDFPRTPDALFPDAGGAFITIIDPMTSSIAYSTGIGNRDWSGIVGHLNVVSPGRVWVTMRADTGLPVTPGALQSECQGQNTPYFALLDLNTDSTLYASYLGRASHDFISGIIPLDSARICLYGHAGSPDFPMPGGGYDSTHLVNGFKAFLVELQLPDSLVHGTFLGGTGGDFAAEAARDESGSVVITGGTRSPDFPLTADAFDRTYHGGEYDIGDEVFLARLSPNLDSLEFSTYFGGSNRDDVRGGLTCFNSHSIWLAGGTLSEDLPVTPGAFCREPSGSYLMRVDLSPNVSPERDPHPVPDQLSLACYPNPFNPSTTLTFTLPRASDVKLEVFDILGRQVYDADLGKLSAGSHQHRIDGSQWASGVYFARVQTSSSTRTLKLLLMR